MLSFPAAQTAAEFPVGARPKLMVVIDTEEEFNWGAPFDRESTGVSAMREVFRAQEIFDAYQLVPTYVSDYPVVSKPDGYQPLVELNDDGRAVIGMHLHPWVSPPHEEAVSQFNSYQGNLDPTLERRKLEVLAEKIAETFGERPRVHKAGRYGFGAATFESLKSVGVDIDLSAAPGFDFRADGGPDYRYFHSAPFWLGESREILEIPTTGGFSGFAHQLGPLVHIASRMAFRPWELGAAVLTKLHAVERVLLSPEGFEVDEMIRLTHALIRRGVKVFTFSFHSPSLKPGCTSYTPDAPSVEAFLDKFRGYFDFFFGELQGEPTTPLEVKTLVS